MISSQLLQFVHTAITKFDSIPDDRKRKMETLSDFVEDRLKDPYINLTFICVHNSRRSHLSQVWAQVAAHHYGFNQVQCYSGGTEVTELFPAAAATLKEQGFQIQTLSEGSNPVYAIKYDENAPAIMGFSKTFDDAYNPKEGFGAILVCSAADKNCPFIADAAERMLIPYNDPKEFDGTPEQMTKYKERSEQIAIEMLYAFSKVDRD